METRIVFTQLLEGINLAIEQKSLPLYDVGASFRLTRNNHPQIKYKDGFQDLIIQILTLWTVGEHLKIPFPLLDSVMSRVME